MSENTRCRKRLDHSELLALKRWNTPTIYNGWEQITNRDAAKEGFNLEQTTDFMQEMGTAVGYAVTVVIEPSNKNHPQENPAAWNEYRRYLSGAAGPKIVVVQDLDKPETFGSFWGEVNANIHRALGCVATITDGAIRDVDEMKNAGFKALARRLCVGHAHSHPIRWGCEVSVFGRIVEPGRLIHLDKHGFLVIPQEDEERLLEAARFMDENECNTMIAQARSSEHRSAEHILEALERASEAFKRATEQKFGRGGEW